MDDLTGGAAQPANPLCEPVHYLQVESEKLQDGMALCLSGGGYRAMLFHAGSLWWLNEIGLLPQLDRISSVSGGSITAGVLALYWSELTFTNNVATNFDRVIVRRIRQLADNTIDASAVIGGALWFGSVGERLANAYRERLFHGATLQDIVDEQAGVAPRFVFNATNVQSGVLWRFMKPYMRDYRVGEVKNPKVDLAVVVAASSAFPPILSPVEMELDPNAFTPDSGTDLQSNEYRKNIVLTDGGVYDNLGLETAWKRYKTIFVSDAGGGFEPEPDPHRDPIRHAVRVLFTIDNQVRSLRKRQIVGAYMDKIRSGVYWSISEDLDRCQQANPLSCPFNRTSELARVDTRLEKLDSSIQERLINWGYASAAWRYTEYFNKEIKPPSVFPYPATGV